MAKSSLCKNRQLPRSSNFLERARLAFQMIFKFFSELLHNRNRRQRGCIAQRTEGASQHVFGQVLNVINVLSNAAACMKTSQCLFQPVSALAARNAPSTALVLIKLHDPEREFHHAGTVVDHDESA